MVKGDLLPVTLGLWRADYVKLIASVGYLGEISQYGGSFVCKALYVLVLIEHSYFDYELLSGFESFSTDSLPNRNSYIWLYFRWDVMNFELEVLTHLILDELLKGNIGCSR